MSTLERAIEVAAAAHAGQQDKAGEPYILHPLRVMLRVASPEERIVAVLHDVVEDTHVTIEQLRAEGFSQTVLDAVDAVTKRDGEGYEEFVARAAHHPVGRAVKLADLLDNSDLSRLPNPTQKDMARLEKYRKAIAFLTAKDWRSRVLVSWHLADGRKAEIAHLNEADAPAALDYIESVAGESDFLTFGPGEFGATLEQEVARIRMLADPAKGMLFKADLEGRMVALASLGRSPRARIRHVGDFGLSVLKAFWGKGIGTALSRAVMAEGRRTGVTRMALQVRDDNVRAIRMYEKLGFKHEGRLRRAMTAHGIEYDLLVMGMRVE